MRREWHIDVDELDRLWRQGVTVYELSARYDVSPATIFRLRRRHDIPDRPSLQSREHDAPSPEEETASADSLAFSPWVQARIKELRLGMRA